ncbi:hypothetical protein GGS20DRAFT_599718 [Poronia punctata]|nr:hypothetical protein GGS20DRAFT_599718 [Poronia punctata]
MWPSLMETFQQFRPLTENYLTHTSHLTSDELAELALLRDAEVSALAEDQLLSLSQPRPLDRELVFQFESVTLVVKTGLAYPACAVTWRLENRALSLLSLENLRSQLRHMADAAANSTNNVFRWRNRHVEGIFTPVQVVLRLAQITREHVGRPYVYVYVPDEPDPSGDNQHGN